MCAIRAVLILEFALKFFLAPDKRDCAKELADGAQNQTSLFGHHDESEPRQRPVGFSFNFTDVGEISIGG